MKSQIKTNNKSACLWMDAHNYTTITTVWIWFKQVWEAQLKCSSIKLINNKLGKKPQAFKGSKNYYIMNAVSKWYISSEWISIYTVAATVYMNKSRISSYHSQKICATATTVNHLQPQFSKENMRKKSPNTNWAVSSFSQYNSAQEVAYRDYHTPNTFSRQCPIG